MKSKLIFLSLILMVAAISWAASPGRAQSTSPSQSTGTATADSDEPEQENTRGAFMTSRPKTVEKPKSTSSSSPSPQRSRRRPVAPTQPPASGAPATSGSTKPGSASTAKKDSKKKAIVQKMGLGLTLFMRDANGLAVRVDPTHEFHKGDRVRVLLETNTDGHLYIFNTTNDGPPEMIYPDPDLDDAGNYLQSHVPLEIPSSLATQEALRWFRFDEKVGNERLYFVFTREPLSGAPIEDELIRMCAADKANCPWHPTEELWAQIRKQLSIPSPVYKAPVIAKPQTSVELQAATRGIGLARDDPEPSLVMMNASTDSGLLVAALVLYHR